MKERPYEIAINPKCDGYQREIVSMFDKKTGAGANVMEFHKPVIKKSERGKVYPRYKDNIWAAD